MSQSPKSVEDLKRRLQAAIRRRDALEAELKRQQDVIIALETGQQEPKQPEATLSFDTNQTDVVDFDTAAYDALHAVLERVGKECEELGKLVDAANDQIRKFDHERR